MNSTALICLFLLNFITSLFNIFSAIIVGTKERKLRSDYFVILTRVGVILFLSYLGICVIGKDFFRIPNIDQSNINSFLCSLFFIYFPMLLITYLIEMNFSFTDPFNIINYLLNKKVSPFIDFLFVLLITTPALIYEILLISPSTRDFALSISVEHFIDGKEPFSILIYNPFIIFFSAVLLILGSFEFANFHLILKQIKIQDNNKRTVNILKMILILFLLFLVLYLTVIIVIWADVGSVRSSNMGILHHIFTVGVYVFLFLEGMMTFVIQGMSDYFYYRFGLRKMGHALSVVFQFNVDDRPSLRSTVADHPNLEPEDSLSYIQGLSGFNFETHEISVFNSYMTLLFQSIIKVVPELSKSRENRTMIENNNSVDRSERKNSMRLKYQSTKAKQMRYNEHNLYKYKFDITELLGELTTNIEPRLEKQYDSEYYAKDDKMYESPFITQKDIDLTFTKEREKQKNFNNTELTNQLLPRESEHLVKINSIYHKKLMSNLFEEESQMELELEELKKNLITHITNNRNFIVYIMTKNLQENNSIEMYKDLKFPLGNNTYFIQLTDTESTVMKYLESYIHYRQEAKQNSFLEDIICVFQFQIKFFTPKYVIITKNRFISPALLPQNFYHMWQILKIGTNLMQADKSSFKIISSSHSKNMNFENIIDSKPLKDVNKSFNSNFVKDPNEMVISLNNFKLDKHHKFDMIIQEDLNFLKKHGINDYSLTVLYYELEKDTESSSNGPIFNPNVSSISVGFGNNNQTSFRQTDRTLLGKSISKFALRISNISKNVSGIRGSDAIYSSYSEDDDAGIIRQIDHGTLNLPQNAYAASLAEYTCVLFFYIDLHKISGQSNCCEPTSKLLTDSSSRRNSFCYSNTNTYNIAYNFFHLITKCFNCFSTDNHKAFKKIVQKKFEGIE